MVPTLCRTLGVKGHRPEVGTRDDKDLVYAFGSINCVEGKLHASTLVTRARHVRRQRDQGPAGRGKASKTRRMQVAFAAHLRQVAKAYPASIHPRVTLVIDNAPWHRGKAVKRVLRRNPQLTLYNLPPYSPKLNVIERVWKWLRQRATHNRLFDTVDQMRTAVTAALDHLKDNAGCVLSLMGNCYASGP
jgi:hypothetical protein